MRRIRAKVVNKRKTFNDFRHWSPPNREISVFYLIVPYSFDYMMYVHARVHVRVACGFIIFRDILSWQVRPDVEVLRNCCSFFSCFSKQSPSSALRCINTSRTRDSSHTSAAPTVGQLKIPSSRCGNIESLFMRKRATVAGCCPALSVARRLMREKPSSPRQTCHRGVSGSKFGVISLCEQT